MSRAHARRTATSSIVLACAVLFACRAPDPAPASAPASADDWTRHGWRVVGPADTHPRFAEPPPDQPKRDNEEPVGELEEDAGPCIPNEQAMRECEGKPGWSYGPQPYVRCKGTAPFPGELEAVYESIRNSSCVCFDVQAVEEQRQQCALIP